MAEISMKSRVTLAEAASLIRASGTEVSFMLQGSMGIGKSSILNSLSVSLPKHLPVYMDATTLDLGDVTGVPHIKAFDGVEVTRFAPNIMLGLHQPKPVLLMIDEFGKAARPVQNTFLRILLERKLGDCALPAGSIVFATTNLATDGVGDAIQPHARNRMSFLTVTSPDSDQWCEWAMNNGVVAEIIAWVQQNPHCLGSYLDPSQKENPYIYKPNGPATAFVTPRSLAKASSIIKHRGIIGLSATTAGVAGCVGESAARDLMAHADLADKLPTWESIVKTPMKAKVPSNSDAASSFITIYGAISRVEKETFSPWLEYCNRLGKEYQAVFASQIVKSQSKRQIAVTNTDFVKWATSNSFLFE